MSLRLTRPQIVSPSMTTKRWKGVPAIFRLALAMEGEAVSLGEYFLVWPADQAEDYPLIKFREWLMAQLEET